MESSSEFVRHMECQTCGSSDGNSLYTDGHTFCFVCNTYGHVDGEPEHPPTMSSALRLQGVPNDFQAKPFGKVCQQYKIYRDGSVLRFYYHSTEGELLGCKVKTKSKNFTYEGITDGTFFGQHLFPTSGKRVVITEGELDAASCQEAMLGGRWCRFQAVPQALRSRSRRTSSGYKTTKRLSCSSTTMRRGVRRRRRRYASYHLARSRSLASKRIKMRQMLSRE